MARVRFVPDSAGFRELLKSPEMAAHLKTRADAVASAARSTAPRDTGAYADSIDVRIVEHPTRVVAQVFADDWKSQIIEANTGNLARALDAAG